MTILKVKRTSTTSKVMHQHQEMEMHLTKLLVSLSKSSIRLKHKKIMRSSQINTAAEKSLMKILEQDHKVAIIDKGGGRQVLHGNDHNHFMTNNLREISSPS